MTKRRKNLAIAIAIVIVAADIAALLHLVAARSSALSATYATTTDTAATANY